MSGSSLDGLDLAMVRFSSIEGRLSYEILAGDTRAYPQSLCDQLLSAYAADVPTVLALDVALGRLYGKWAKEFIHACDHKPYLIASHGHTLFHNPAVGYSQQLGHPAHLVAATGLPVVADFRNLDIALGGQGAPLVPMGDAMLFSEYAVCLNLGGIANWSFDHNGRRLAWDLALCNQVLNYLANQLGKAYDDKGSIAAANPVNADLLNQLENLSYYTLSPPKSLGREYFEAEVFPLLQQSPLSIGDQLATYTEHIARVIGKEATRQNLRGKMLVTGGGAFNTHLLNRIAAHCRLTVEAGSELLINQKEALVFALLGHLRYLEKNNVLASVTGCRYDHSGGNVYLPPC